MPALASNNLWSALYRWLIGHNRTLEISYFPPKSTVIVVSAVIVSPPTRPSNNFNASPSKKTPVECGGYNILPCPTTAQHKV